MGTIRHCDGFEVSEETRHSCYSAIIGLHLCQEMPHVWAALETNNTSQVRMVNNWCTAKTSLNL
jgi:hypothetical protein